MSHDNHYRLFAGLTVLGWSIYAFSPDGWMLAASVAVTIGLVFCLVRARREAGHLR